MESFIQVCQCLADPKSVRIALILQVAALRINQLERITGLSRRVIDARLLKMQRCDVVTSELDGRWLRWRLTDQANQMIQAIAAQHQQELEWDPDLSNDRLGLARELNLPIAVAEGSPEQP